MSSSSSSRPDPVSALDAPAPPASCPICASRDLTTAGKIVTADTYWRCRQCGEVWNVGRLQAGSRFSRNPPFRR